MLLDPGYIRLWIPFISVCVLAVLVLSVLLGLIYAVLGNILDEFKRFNDNDERLYPTLPLDENDEEDDDDDWNIEE